MESECNARLNTLRPGDPQHVSSQLKGSFQEVLLEEDILLGFF